MTAATLPRHRHRKPRLHRRILARLRDRRQRRQVEAARDDAYVVRIEAHAPPPLAQAQASLTALYNVLHHEHGYTVPPLADGFSEPPGMRLCEPCTIGCGGLLSCIDSACACPCRWAAKVAAAGPPPAAVLPDEPDERWPHLAPAYDDSTQAFGLSITEAGQ